MGEYFNEEDLINDYINDAADGEEPPFDYEEYAAAAIMEPEEDESGAKATNDNDAPGGANDAKNNAAAAAGGDDNSNANDCGLKTSSLDNAAAEFEDEEIVPRLISTSPAKPVPSSSSSSLLDNNNNNIISTTGIASNNNDKPDLYGFERFSGLSGWRAKPAANAEDEKGGATTMEATAWKKKTHRQGTSNNNKKNGTRKKKKQGEFSDDDDDDDDDNDDDDNDDDDDDSSIDSNDLDNARQRQKRPKSTGVGSGSGARGTSNKGGEAQLVRFREKEARILLGRSWGETSDGGIYDEAGCTVDGNDMPTLGEASVAITLMDGTRTFVRRRGGERTLTEDDNASADEEGSEGNADANGGSGGAKEKEETEECLLGLPMTELVRRADILQRRAVRRKLERQERRNLDKAMDDSMEDNQDSNDDAADNSNNGEDMDDAQQESIRQQKEDTKKRNRKRMQLQNALWVDKHAPTGISHLLSDERTNREVLRALRAWDPYVFKREAPARPAPAYPSKWVDNDDDWRKNKKKGDGGTAKEGGGGKEGGGEDGNARADARPNETSRVILLSGPPGVGKTTLAHIVAKHAGYRPIEVNASDERSASALTERVTRAMESSTLTLETNEETGATSIGGNVKHGKPNCIILDEVDGADARASIAALVDIIRADMPPPGSKSKKVPYLRRPIILICNHKYAPALRPILAFAKQFDVNPPSPERLTSRLRAVLASERMSVVAGGMLLHRLVGSTGGDVRSCLYALQFASARAREVALKKLKLQQGGVGGDNKGASIMVDISSTLVAALGDGGNGMKDIRSDVSSTVAAVFRKAKSSQRKKRQKTGSSNNPISSSTGVNHVLSSVDRFNDNSKTLDALFLNVNRVSYVDPAMDRTSSAFEWLSGADTYRSHKSSVAMNNGAEHMSMQKYYIPSAAGAVHLLCRVETRPDLTFSTRPLGDVWYQNQANESLVKRFVEGLSTRSRRGAGGAGLETVVEDVIPYGLWLLSAGDGKGSLDRPVSSVDVMTEEERVAFGGHVETLRALGLTYVKDENNGGFDSYDRNVEHRLEPEIDKLVKFENMDDGNGGGADRKHVPSQLKELLAHGATVAALRERETESRLAQQEAVALAEKNKVKGKPKKLQPVVAEKAAEPKEVAKTTPKANTSITPKKQPIKANAQSNSSAAKNFLGFRAAKAKENKTARRAARVGFVKKSKTKVKLSNTGSGVDISKVIRFKYQKGFTQAVRAPCQLEDLL